MIILRGMFSVLWWQLAGLRGRVMFGLARVLEVVVGLLVLQTVFPVMRATGRALKHPHPN